MRPVVSLSQPTHIAVLCRDEAEERADDRGVVVLRGILDVRGEDRGAVVFRPEERGFANCSVGGGYRLQREGGGEQEQCSSFHLQCCNLEWPTWCRYMFSLVATAGFPPLGPAFYMSVGWTEGASKTQFPRRTAACQRTQEPTRRAWWGRWGILIRK